MKQHVLWFSFFFLLVSSANSQQKAKKDSFDHKLSIRNAFEEPTDKASPAKASFTVPDTGKNSFLINLGISLDLLWTRQFNNDKIFVQKLSPFAVFNRNTMIDKEQFNYKGGFAYELQFGTGDDNHISVHYLNSALQYIRDKIDSAHSVLLTGYWSYLFNNTQHPENKFFINYYKMIGKSSFFYNVSPSAGYEFQDIYQSKKDSSGFQSRLYLSPSASIALRSPSKSQRKAKNTNPYTWPKLFELTVDYKFRYAFINTVTGSPDYVPLFKPSLTYYPGYSQDFSIALSYNSGADPTAGLNKQKYWELAVQFKK